MPSLLKGLSVLISKLIPTKPPDKKPDSELENAQERLRLLELRAETYARDHKQL